MWRWINIVVVAGLLAGGVMGVAWADDDNDHSDPVDIEDMDIGDMLDGDGDEDGDHEDSGDGDNDDGGGDGDLE
jgi:hypothetical protein